jgi:hypothetical protein
MREITEQEYRDFAKGRSEVVVDRTAVKLVGIVSNVR